MVPQALSAPWPCSAATPACRQPPSPKAYRSLRLITGVVWSVAIVGVAAWAHVETRGLATAADTGAAVGTP